MASVMVVGTPAMRHDSFGLARLIDPIYIVKLSPSPQPFTVKV